ncbi:putative enzyme of poly-gamma-glutamate biosynthesis (Capsule formation)-like protein [Richelia sinica FACHB-800]|uniref:Enzyme of poly-gamma-glutamate biosynthesis (Capsule formation)-like protein n=1 Tax=Richelia sinica FACHB-800 TaxID=1357546 RepID=A0A975TCB3_9NOST|nr:CapA family protein [Richelia sinica]MBD2666779.1 CapA family protein [Richelia sinica FACHB-800]QXE26074.1 putative enzyme of poly-gamma-glutamate biosynthesis (Capsule formation)-like protein [Richelia sinica FACHB-800]
MRNRRRVQFFSLAFLSVCFCLGIGLGTIIRFGQLQESDAATVESPLPNPDPNPNLETDDNIVTIKAVGDIIPGTNFPNHRLPRDRNLLIPPTVRGYLQKADIVFGNFESSLTNHPYSSKDISRGQTFAFRSPPSYGKLFADVGFNVFNIANNHALDFGIVGLRDTIKNLHSVGIKTLGHKNQILYLQVQDVPIAMIGFTTYNFYNSVHNLKAATALVEKAKETASIVIVSMQVGAEGTSALRVKNKTEFFYGENRGNSVQFARKMIDAGADLILGHGPHVPRAIEFYKGKMIAYSLGNFLGYRTLSTQAQTAYSMILEVKLDSTGNLVASKVIPVHLNKQGIPQIDQYFRTVGLLRYLNNADFPQNQITINQRGEIIVSNQLAKN